jgi:hypothetical protein
MLSLVQLDLRIFKEIEAALVHSMLVSIIYLLSWRTGEATVSFGPMAIHRAPCQRGCRDLTSISISHLYPFDS